MNSSNTIELSNKVHILAFPVSFSATSKEGSKSFLRVIIGLGCVLIALGSAGAILIGLLTSMDDLSIPALLTLITVFVFIGFNGGILLASFAVDRLLPLSRTVELSESTITIYENDHLVTEISNDISNIIEESYQITLVLGKNTIILPKLVYPKNKSLILIIFPIIAFGIGLFKYYKLTVYDRKLHVAEHKSLSVGTGKLPIVK